MPRLGIWITVFSPERILYSTENIDRLIENCEKSGVNDIFLQIYRADKAYYDSGVTDRTSFDAMLSEANTDPIKYLLDKARAKGLKVHAWMNILSLARNEDANIIKKFGHKVITKDQHGRASFSGADKDKLDKYYIRENQLFLEPGDSDVREYVSGIAEEIIVKYPDLNGLHLDYIRYPAVVPFVPGSRFNSHGISYGYTPSNINNFKKATGINVKTMEPSRENFRKWDGWRRDQVTSLVRDISERARKVSPDIEISCTIVPSVERTHLVTFQDWTVWVRESLVDFVVAMNYTDDIKLMELNSSSLLIAGLEDKVFMGLGAYLLKEDPGLIENQIDRLLEIGPGGVVIFSYDEVAASEELRKFLAERFILKPESTVQKIQD